MWKKSLELTGDHAAAFTAAAIEAVMEISADETAAEIFKAQHFADGADREALVSGVMRKSIPALLNGHREALYRLFAANQGISAEEYKASATPLTLTADISGMISDLGFRAFFSFAQPTMRRSGSARENTGAPKPSEPSLPTQPLRTRRKRKKKRGGTISLSA